MSNFSTIPPTIINMQNTTAITRKKCRVCKEQKGLSSFFPDRLGKYGRASTCKDCKRIKEKKQPSAHKGEVQKTIHAEKLIAYERDNGCIVPGCLVRDFNRIEFHHVYWHALEQKINDPSRNKHFNGVILCSHHHAEIPRSKDLDQFCRDYLRTKHPNKH